MRPRKTATLALSIGLLLSVRTEIALADEHTYCPDMGEKKAVLDEANKYLDSHGGAPAHFSKGTVTFVPQEYYEVPDAELLKITERDVDAMPLGTEIDEMKAIRTAGKLVEANHYDVALKLYKRLLKAEDNLKNHGHYTVKLLADIAFSTIMESASPQTIAAMPKSRYKRLFTEKELFPYHDDFAEAKRQFLVTVIQNAPNSDGPNLKLAESYYDRALASDATVYASSGDILSCFIFSAVLKDKRGATGEAEVLLKKATNQSMEAAPYLVGFYLEHKNFEEAQRLQKALLELYKTDFSWRTYAYTLSLFYAQAPKSDTQVIFSQLLSAGTYLPPALLTKMFDLLEPEDRVKLSQYLVRSWLPVCNQKQDSNGILSLLQTLDKIGLKEQSAAVCNEIVEYRGNIDELIAVARFYTGSHQTEKALQLYEKIRYSKSTLGSNHEDIVAYLEQVKSDLDGQDLQDLATAKQIRLAVAVELDFHKDQIKRRQCMEMAQKLNDTACKLEASNHFAMAAKTYTEALKIKLSNLSANDPEVSMQMIDIARCEAGCKDNVTADKLYQSALTLLRKSQNTEPRALMNALQNYGQFLNSINEKKKSDDIYAESRFVAKQATIK